MTPIHRCEGFPDVRHCECGGEIAVAGQGWVELPHGFGFPTSGPKAGKFVVDTVRYKTYAGFCMKCKAEGDFIRTDQKPAKRRRSGAVKRK